MAQWLYISWDDRRNIGDADIDTHALEDILESEVGTQCGECTWHRAILAASVMSAHSWRTSWGTAMCTRELLV